jgi:tRNA pseudouridine38-40 synthase
MSETTTYRYFIHLSFDGTAYHGWQIQPNAVTVQQILLEKLQILLGEDTMLTGSGRTDSGVHARHYTAHFDTNRYFSSSDAHQLTYKLNCILPPDIAILGIQRVKADVHARFSATSRSYEYIICGHKNPFMINRAWRQERPLDIDSMQKASEILLEYEDFECFSRSNTQVNNYLCKIFEADWRQEEDLLIFHISANRFLRNMVRAIVGTITDVGLGKITPEYIRTIIESRSRSKAGYSVPGCGLYFLGAKYPDIIYL